jgi:hypothetical protein
MLRIRIRIDFGLLDLDPNPGGQQLPSKIEKTEEISSFEVLDVLFLRAEGFSCNLDVLYEGLGIVYVN